MDIATLFGLILGMGVIGMAVASGADMGSFINLPGVLIVLGGTFSATLIKFPLQTCFSAFKLGIVTAFANREERPEDLIQSANQMAALARRKGVLALEDEVVGNPFFQKGVQLLADGRSPEFVEKVLTREMELSIERHEHGELIFRAIGESAPAFGMIGTLVGLVQMLTTLEDPSKIGPGMAVALLTTLYGALFAHLFALPIAEKLRLRSVQEHNNKAMIIEGVLSIQKGENPRLMDELLEAYVPDKQREALHQPKDTGANGAE